MIRRLRSNGAIAVGVGLLSFAVAFLTLTFLTTPHQPAGASPSAEATAAPAGGVTAQHIASGRVAVGLTIPADQTLLFEALPGDRLDILAVLTSVAGQSSVAAVVVSGASVLQAPSSPGQAAVLLEVTPSDAQVLAHLVGLGTPLSYALWSASGRPAIAPPVDARTALASLGLMPTAVLPATKPTPLAQPTLMAATPTPQQVMPTQTPGAERTATATPGVNPDESSAQVQSAEPDSGSTVVASAARPAVYFVRRGDTLVSIARQFDIDFTTLMWANRHLPNRDLLLPGTEIYLPDYRGTLYVVHAGDTWDGLGQSLGYPSDTLKQINDLSPAAPLEVGMQLFVPTGL